MNITASLARLLSVLAWLGSVAVAPLAAAAQVPPDIGWPRVYVKDGKELTIYQPQVDAWKDYADLHFRCAVSVKGVLPEEKFGVAEIDSTTVVDFGTRTVAVVPRKRQFRFGKVSEAESAALNAAVEQLAPSTAVTTIALDRVLACLDPSKQPTQRKAEVNLDPPKIHYSSTPALLVVLLGPPKLKPVEADRTDLMFVVNTNWDILYDTASKQYFLLDGDQWLTTTDLLAGRWFAAGQFPPSLSTLPADENWAEARRCIPGKPAKAAPTVFVGTEPAELIVTDGVPEFAPIAGSRLLRVDNTPSVLFLNTSDGKYYLLAAGRWFRAGGLTGPWSAASKDLPAEFAKIPDDDASAFVKASVPGTREAQDAVLLASIPNTTVIDLAKPPPVQVVFDGQPKFVVVQGATGGVQYAVNTPSTVFLVDGKYYCCSQGIWFTGAAAAGPWAVCAAVPPAIYTIPPAHPAYNVTYVTVQAATPTSVTYVQTAGYSGEYVAATGVLMFGAGMLLGAAIADDDHHHYYPPYPAHYSYGCAATYHYGYGGYHSAGHAYYGPYGGAGYATAYNPATGTYGRATYAYGPYGAAGTKAAYNPYTGGYAAAAGVTTPYGSAARGAAYNPNTGTHARGAAASGEYGSAAAGRAYNPRTGAYAQGGAVSTDRGTAAGGSAYNPNTGRGVAAGGVSGEQGSAGAVRTTGGAGAAAWDTKNSEGAVARTKSGDVYASDGDTVYKKGSDGSWQSNSGDGWENTSKPEGRGGTGASASSQSMESQAAARERGNQKAQSTSQSRSPASAGGSAPSSRSGSRSTPTRSAPTRSGGGRR